MNLVTAHIPINKITAHVNWFGLRCMDIDREFPLMTLSKRRKALFRINTQKEVNRPEASIVNQ